jgi:SNF2 family DNA or RNA helicase
MFPVDLPEACLTLRRYHHQLLAAEWMVKRELGEEGPHGGILADVMGLGKTLEVLAVMVGNPPPENETKNNIKGTLIVMPSSVINQWKGEIGIHTEPNAFPRITHFSSQKSLPEFALTDADVVLTSYNEVMRSYPYPSKSDMGNFQICGGYDGWAKANGKVPGILHQIEWYRIVLDEA